MVEERRLPDTSPGNDCDNVTTLACWFAHASSRKPMSSSRPKTSLPVIGNLATEIFFGTSLAVQEFDEYDLISLRWQGEEMPVWIAPEPSADPRHW
jgi:hypothetical protein